MLIALTQGRQAAVSPEDYDYLSQWKWCYANGYAKRGVYNAGSKVTVLMHRVVLERMGFKDFKDTDHINRDRADNRRSNLRPATRTENGRNRGPQRNNKSGFKGVHWDKRLGKWQARIRVNGKNIHLGYFDNLQDAISARLSAEAKYFGEFTYAM